MEKYNCENIELTTTRQRNSVPEVKIQDYLSLHEAASNGDALKLSNLMYFVTKKLCNIDQADDDWDGRAPIHFACYKGCL